MEPENHYQQGTEATEVLVSDVKEAAKMGWALTSEPRTVPIEGSRLVYRISPTSGARTLVAVLSAGQTLTPGIKRSITASLKVHGGMVRKADVVNRKQLIARLGCADETVDRWRRIPSFPKPFVKMGDALLWDLREVRTWIRERDRYLSPARRAGRSS